MESDEPLVALSGKKMDCTEICFNQSKKIIVQETVALTQFKNWQGSDACLSKIKPQ